MFTSSGQLLISLGSHDHNDDSHMTTTVRCRWGGGKSCVTVYDTQPVSHFNFDGFSHFSLSFLANTLALSELFYDVHGDVYHIQVAITKDPTIFQESTCQLE